MTKILREVATSERFSEFSALKVAFLRRLCELQVRYRQCDFDDAFAVVSSNVTLVHLAPALRVCHVERPEGEAFSRKDAERFWSELPGLVKAMPGAMGYPR